MVGRARKRKQPDRYGVPVDTTGRRKRQSIATDPDEPFEVLQEQDNRQMAKRRTSEVRGGSSASSQSEDTQIIWLHGTAGLAIKQSALPGMLEVGAALHPQKHPQLQGTSVPLPGPLPPVEEAAANLIGWSIASDGTMPCYIYRYPMQNKVASVGTKQVETQSEAGGSTREGMSDTSAQQQKQGEFQLSVVNLGDEVLHNKQANLASPVQKLAGESTLVPPAQVSSLPVNVDGHVSQSVKEKIWSHQYIEMSVLLNDAGNESSEITNMELAVTNDKQLLLKPPKRKAISSYDSWSRAWCVFSYIYCAKYSDRYQELLGYNEVIRRAYGQFGVRALNYDREFRRGQAKLTGERRWDLIDQTAYAMECLGGQSVNKQKPIRFCYEFNNTGGCDKSDCEFAHKCQNCKKGHPSKLCRFKKTGQVKGHKGNKDSTQPKNYQNQN